MITCPKCGKEVEEGNYFCKFCGSALNTSPGTTPRASGLRGVIESRLNSIRNTDEKMLEDIVDRSTYSKFDDWPPFSRQDSREALENEKGAYKVMREYNYEIKDYQENILDGTALATFHIHYWGTVRDRSFDVNSRVTIVLKRIGGLWKMVHEHWSRIPEDRQRRGLFG